jgi:hypothetical protein
MRRALRGGSWNNHGSNARCGVRNRNNPNNRNDNIGFRALRPSHIFLVLPRRGTLGCRCECAAICASGWRPLPEMFADHGLRTEA